MESEEPEDKKSMEEAPKKPSIFGSGGSNLFNKSSTGSLFTKKDESKEPSLFGSKDSKTSGGLFGSKPGGADKEDVKTNLFAKSGDGAGKEASSGIFGQKSSTLFGGAQKSNDSKPSVFGTQENKEQKSSLFSTKDNKDTKPILFGGMGKSAEDKSQSKEVNDRAQESKGNIRESLY